jgi:uncharacterized membrane protein
MEDVDSTGCKVTNVLIIVGGVSGNIIFLLVKGWAPLVLKLSAFTMVALFLHVAILNFLRFTPYRPIQCHFQN